jgi:hypothetical protein
MSFKLSFGEPKYFVNEEKGVVTCVMNYRLKYPNEDWRLVNAIKYVADCYIEDKDNMLRYPFTVDAQAKLDPKDKFDVEVGKKVARAKAESSAYRYVTKQIEKVFAKFINKYVDMRDEFFVKADSVIEHNNHYLAQF